VGRLFERGKAGLRGWGAAIEQCAREGFLGPKIRNPSRVGSVWLTNGGVFQYHIEGGLFGSGDVNWRGQRVGVEHARGVRGRGQKTEKTKY
jgi:hypothetical protein